MVLNKIEHPCLFSELLEDSLWMLLLVLCWPSFVINFAAVLQLCNSNSMPTMIAALTFCFMCFMRTQLQNWGKLFFGYLAF